MSLALKNNNPGNLRYAGQSGAVDNGGFAKFSDPDSGYLALMNDVRAKVTGATSTKLTPTSTLNDFVKVYAPPNENDTDQYVLNLANTLKKAPDTQLKEFQGRENELADAIAKNEDAEFYNKYIAKNSIALPQIEPKVQYNPSVDSKQQEEVQSKPKGIGGFLGGLYKGLVGGTVGAVENTGRNINTYGGGAVAYGLDKLLGTNKYNTFADATGSVGQKFGGMDDQGNVTNSLTQGLGGEGQRLATTPGQFAGDLVQTAALAIPGGNVGSLSGLAKVSKLAKTGAATGALSGAGNALSNDGGLVEIAKQTGVGALAGGVLGAASAPLIKTVPKEAGAIEKELSSYLGNIEGKTSSATSLKNLTGEINENPYLYGKGNEYTGIQDFAIKESLDNGVPLFQVEDLGNGRTALITSESIDVFESQIAKAKKLADDVVEQSEVKGTREPYIDADTGELVKPNAISIAELKQQVINEATNKAGDPITKNEIIESINNEFDKILRGYGNKNLSSRDVNALKNRMWETYRDNPTSASQKANKLMGQVFKTQTEKMIPDIKLQELNKQIMRYNDLIKYLEKLGKVKLGNNLGSQTSKLIKDYVAGKFVKGVANIFTGGVGGDLIEGAANLGYNKFQNSAAQRASQFPIGEKDLAGTIGKFTNPEVIKAKGILNQNSSLGRTQNNIQTTNSTKANLNIPNSIPQKDSAVSSLLKQLGKNSLRQGFINTTLQNTKKK